jgi:hypothetical protein
MRVWLVCDKKEPAPGVLESALRGLAARPEKELHVLGVSTRQLEGTEAVEKLAPEMLDVLVIDERAWCEDNWIAELLKLGIAGVLAVRAGQVERFRPLAALHPLTFVSLVPEPEQLWLALCSANAARQRHLQWKMQVDRLQQRLNDRIIIERAKGILVERLHITEEDAYKRLRVLSRRQRRQIRDIAQSLLDTQFLFNVNAAPNGAVKPGSATAREGEQPQAKEK